MIRSTLKARGAHAAIFSIMLVPPEVLNALDSYRVAALRESAPPKQNQQLFAKQHRNNFARRVFAARPVTAASSRCSKQKGRELIPAVL
jgi:hypothetical protein